MKKISLQTPVKITNIRLMEPMLILLIMLFFVINGYSQLINVNSYRFNAANSAASAITATQLIPANSDSVASIVTDIGFTFWFAGSPYTQFSVSENGLMTLGSTQISGPDDMNLMASGNTIPKIAPYWDDLATGTTGSVGYQLTGTAPNRVLRINWNVTVPKNPTGAANAIFQVQLYETGDIFFATGSGTFPAANANQYSMGIGTSTTDFASVTVASTQTSSTCAYGIANDANTLSAGAGKRYQFAVDKTAPTITAVTTPLIGAEIDSLTATIADQAGLPVTGIPTSGSFVPRIYYKKNDGGSWVSTPGVLISGNGTTGSWKFKIEHSLVGGVAEGDQIYYYLIAQDQADYKGSPNISSSPAGVVATNVNTVITPPANPPYFLIPTVFSGTKTVGIGGNYASLTLPGGLFDQMNAGQLSGNLTVNIISDLTSETGQKGLNAWANGSGGPYTVTINPVGQRIVSGVSVNGGTANVISLNGVTGLTIDGLNDGTNSLTFIQTGQYYVGSVIDLKSASNNYITNVTINGYGASNYAISITNSTSASSNNIISYCNITNPSISSFIAGNGIGLLGTATLNGDHNIIDHNTISNFIYFHINVAGKYSNTEISNNEIFNDLATAWHNNFKAINIGSGVTGTTNTFNNKIHDLTLNVTAQGGPAPAIYSANATGTTSNIYNNVIYLDASFTHPSQIWNGIQTAGAGVVNIYYNSIYIGGTNITAGNSYGIKRDGTGTTNIRNNIVFNARSNSSGTGKHYGIYLASTTSLTSNYNDIYTNGVGGYFGFSALDRLTIADWQIATSKDMNSVSVNPQFVSNVDFHSAAPELNNGGITIPAVVTDFDNIVRTNPPDIGAYEFILPIYSINTLATTSINSSSAVLQGNINTANEMVAISFDYGLTDTYGSTATGIPDTVRSLVSTPDSAFISSLAPNTLYHYRIVGTSATSAETIYGSDMTFTTTGGIAGLWTGITSSEWANASNWDNQIVPGTLNDVVIPASAPNWPIFTGTITLGATCNSITLAGATSQLTVTFDMIIPTGFTVTNNGTIHLLNH
jgi:hypothetical protein